MRDVPLICSVVLTWNNFDDTDECLESMVRQEYASHRIIVVDNASDDGSGARLEAKWGDRVSFLRNPANLGCGGGYAAGITRALEMGAEYVAIIDNDIVAAPSLLGRLLCPFGGDDTIGLVSPVMTYFDDPQRIWFARGSYHRLLGITRHDRLNAPLTSICDLLGRTYRTDYAPSCAVLLSRKALAATGLPDERLFFGHDDVDWCLRASDRGYRSVVVGEPLVRHKVSTTGGQRGSTVFTDFSAYHHARGSVLVGAKHAKGIRLAPYLAGQVLVRLPYYSWQMIRAGHYSGPLSYARGLVAGLRYLLPGGS